MNQHSSHFLIVNTIILLAVFCQTQASVDRYKRQSPDIGAIAIEGAAAAMEIFQNGAAMKKDFAITGPGEEVSDSKETKF